jgi:hypothetical protein
MKLAVARVGEPLLMNGRELEFSFQPVTPSPLASSSRISFRRILGAPPGVTPELTTHDA